jgi:hypothetical protein
MIYMGWRPCAAVKVQELFEQNATLRGWAVLVGHFKPTLKTPETMRLKLKCDESLPEFAFKFNLRRYSEAP